MSKGPARTHKVYRWTVPAKAAGQWRWRQGKDEYQLAITQHYSAVNAALTRNGKAVPVREARLRGRQLLVSYGTETEPGQFDAMIKGGEMDIRSTQGKTLARAHRTESVVAGHQ
jgi:hypothetical protein